MCMSSPKSPAPPPPPPPAPPAPTPPAASASNLPKADAYTDAKQKKKNATSVRSTLQIPLTSSSSGSGVNTNK